jgi:hypothetical protein
MKPGAPGAVGAEPPQQASVPVELAWALAAAAEPEAPPAAHSLPVPPAAQLVDQSLAQVMWTSAYWLAALLAIGSGDSGHTAHAVLTGNLAPWRQLLAPVHASAASSVPLAMEALARFDQLPAPSDAAALLRDTGCAPAAAMAAVGGCCLSGGAAANLMGLVAIFGPGRGARVLDAGGAPMGAFCPSAALYVGCLCGRAPPSTLTGADGAHEDMLSSLVQSMARRLLPVALQMMFARPEAHFEGLAAGGTPLDALMGMVETAAARMAGELPPMGMEREAAGFAPSWLLRADFQALCGEAAALDMDDALTLAAVAEANTVELLKRGLPTFDEHCRAVEVLQLASRLRGCAAGQKAEAAVWAPQVQAMVRDKDAAWEEAWRWHDAFRDTCLYFRAHMRHMGVAGGGQRPQQQCGGGGGNGFLLLLLDGPSSPPVPISSKMDTLDLSPAASAAVQRRGPSLLSVAGSLLDNAVSSSAGSCRGRDDTLEELETTPAAAKAAMAAGASVVVMAWAGSCSADDALAVEDGGSSIISSSSHLQLQGSGSFIKSATAEFCGEEAPAASGAQQGFGDSGAAGHEMGWGKKVTAPLPPGGVSAVSSASSLLERAGSDLGSIAACWDAAHGMNGGEGTVAVAALWAATA